MGSPGGGIAAASHWWSILPAGSGLTERSNPKGSSSLPTHTSLGGFASGFLGMSGMHVLLLQLAEEWRALGDDFRTLPMSQIVADIPHFIEVQLV